MLLHVFNNQLELVNEPVNLEQAFQILEEHNNQSECKDNFIGFTIKNNDKAILQFVRQTEETWSVDIPTYSNDEYSGSLYSVITKSLVFSLVRDFFDSQSSMNKCINNQNYDEVVEYSKIRFGLSYDLVLE